MRTFIRTSILAGLCTVGMLQAGLIGQDAANPQQNTPNAAAANLMHNHYYYPGQMGARRGFFGPAYYGPTVGYGPYYQGLSIPSIQPRRFGSSPDISGGAVPIVRPRVGGSP